MLFRSIAPLTYAERTALAAGVSLMLAVFFEFYLKYLAGRYWPETWTHGNPSLIGTGDYGFHPFHFGEAYGSFPSGHTARTVAVLSVVGLAYPKLRLPCAGFCVLVAVSLVAMNYHFVGDTIGGVLLGLGTGVYTTAFFASPPGKR